MIAHVADYLTWSEDIDLVLAGQKAREWDQWIVPSESMVTTVRNELWLRAGWANPTIVVWPEAVRTIRTLPKRHSMRPGANRFTQLAP